MNSLSIVNAAAERPDNAAVMDEQGKLWTYETLARRVEARLAKMPMSVRPGVRVALSYGPSLEGIVEVLAMIERRACLCMLHPRWPGEVLESTRVSVGAAQAPEYRRLRSPAAPMGEHPMAVFFTSGSEGPPKAVLLSEQNFLAAAASSEAVLGWQEADRWLLNLPLAHIGGFSILTRALRARKCVVLPPADWARFEAPRFVEYVKLRECTLLSLVPTMLRRIVRSHLSCPPSVRAVLVGGAAASGDLLRSARTLGWPALATYGMTETCAQITLQRLAEPIDGHAGYPLPGIELRIRQGTIEVKSASVCLGYEGSPSMATRVVENSSASTGGGIDDDGWFRTQDFGRIDEQGRVWVLGRGTEMIISGGENVSPARVEQAFESIEGVHEAVAYGIDSQEWGQEVGVDLVLVQGWDLGIVKLRAFERLAPFERPKHLRVVEALPRLHSGKVNRRKARESAQEYLNKN